MTHNETVEKLVHHEAEEADCDVADWINEIKVFQYFSQRFGERAVVSHHTHGQYNGIHHLTFNKMLLTETAGKIAEL